MQATQNDILNLQLSNTRTRDKLYWRENKAQQFTVKTAYQVALRLHREMGVEQSTVGEERKIIMYSRSIINACSLLSHEWWVPPFI